MVEVVDLRYRGVLVRQLLRMMVMQIASEMVALSGEEYRQYIEMRRHEREILRCLLVLDIPGIRKVWKEMAPHLGSA